MRVRVRATKNLSDRQMPYDIVKMGSKYAVKTTAGPNKGKTHGLTTKPKAEAQMRLLNYLITKKKK
jgi:hypothetical protein